jgi:hypothetical protein
MGYNTYKMAHKYPFKKVTQPIDMDPDMVAAMAESLKGCNTNNKYDWCDEDSYNNKNNNNNDNINNNYNNNNNINNNNNNNNNNINNNNNNNNNNYNNKKWGDDEAFANFVGMEEAVKCRERLNNHEDLGLKQAIAMSVTEQLELQKVLDISAAEYIKDAEKYIKFLNDNIIGMLQDTSNKISIHNTIEIVMDHRKARIKELNEFKNYRK